MSTWKKVWGSLEIPWGAQVGSLEDITQKIWIQNAWTAHAVQVRFCNAYGREPLVLERVSAGLWDREKKQVTKIVPITADGSERITIEPGTAFYSDEAALSLTPEYDIVISAYFKSAQKIDSVCQTWCAQGFRTSFCGGDAVSSAFWGMQTTLQVLPSFARDAVPCNAAAGINGLKICTDRPPVTLACFGDSITHMGYYFDPLREMVQRHRPGEYALLNYGIGGNRLLFDDCYVEEIIGHGKCFGQAGISRFVRDVYIEDTPDTVFFMEGVNDCTHAFAFGCPNEVPTGEMLFNGMKQIIETAHKNKSKIYVSTVMPFGCFGEPFREKAECIRQDFNQRIRESSALADGLIDLDMVMRMPNAPDKMKDDCHIGDGVHPNTEGGRRIARAIFEHLFKGEMR